MIRQVLEERAERLHAQRELARLQASQFIRDQFMLGYRTGYKKGRADERDGAFDIIGPDLDPPHPQVDAGGIDVDEGMRALLLALWDRGFDTQFSCQGDPEKFGPNQHYSRDYATQIVFGNFDDAVRFMRESAQMLGFKNYTEGGVMLSTMAPVTSDVPRAEVTFSPLLLEELTAHWRSLHTPLGELDPPVS